MSLITHLKKSICALLMILVLFCSSAEILSYTAPITAEAATIKINKKKITLSKGKTYQLKIKGTTKKVTWKSNKPSVAKVNSKGLVKAKKKGTAKIIAKVRGKKYTCMVTVKDKKQNKPTVPDETETPETDPSQTEPEQTEPEQTKPEQTEPEQTEPEQTEPEQTEPEQSEPEQTEPEQSEPEQTEPEQTEPEQTEPEQTEPEQSEPEQSEPEQTEPEQSEPEQTEPEQTEPEQTKPEQSEFSVSSTNLTINQSGSVSITYTGTGTIRYQISDPDICSCSGSWDDGPNRHTMTLNIKGKKSGTAIITITNGVDDRKLEITVNVDLYPQSITLNSTAETLYIGKSFSLTVSVSPSYAEQDVTWSSSNDSIAAVSEYGEVIAISAGQATITATSKDGRCSAQCIVTVKHGFQEPQKSADFPYKALSRSF